MQRIKGYEPGDGSAKADVALDGIGRLFGGHVPNFHKVMARSPAVIEAFEAVRVALAKTALRGAEREVVALEVSRRNRCAYCIAVHSRAARLHRVDAGDIQALLDGKTMPDARLELIRRAVGRLWETRGDLPDAELAAFRDEGLGDAELMEIIAIIGFYVWATIANNLIHTDIDPLFQEGG